MPSIYQTPRVTPTHTDIRAIYHPSLSALSLAIGEMLEVFIVDKANLSTFVLNVKNAAVLAETDLSLSVGDRITVKVEQLEPQVVLHIINREDAVDTLAFKYLRDFLTNHEALPNMIARGRDLLVQQSFLDLLPEKTKMMVKHTLMLMNAVIISPESLKDPHTLSGYIGNLGLVLEYGLKKMVQGSQEMRNQPTADNLKSALTALSGELQQIVMGAEHLGENEKEIITRIMTFTNSSLNAIEAEQVINVLAQEHEGKYVLHIPLLVADGLIQKAEMYIEIEKGMRRGKKDKLYCVVVFLTMDALGDIMVKASARRDSLDCLFAVENQETQLLISSFLDSLKNSIHLLGFKTGYMECITKTDVQAEREQARKDLLNVHDRVNLFA